MKPRPSEMGVLPTQCSAFLNKACLEGDPSRCHDDAISTSCRKKQTTTPSSFLAFFCLMTKLQQACDGCLQQGALWGGVVISWR